MGDRLQRLWPSLVALVGTVAVVLALLWYFGDNTEDSTPDDVVAGDATGTEAPATDTPPATPPPATTPPDAPTDDPTDEPGEPVTADPEVREPLGVLNQTDEAGLEEQARERFEEGGWEVAAVSEFTGTVPETTVYVPEGMEEAAEALVAQFPEIGRIRPNVEPFNDTRLVIVLVDDYLDEVG